MRILGFRRSCTATESLLFWPEDKEQTCDTARRKADAKHKKNIVEPNGHTAFRDQDLGVSRLRTNRPTMLLVAAEPRGVYASRGA